MAAAAATTAAAPSGSGRLPDPAHKIQQRQKHNDANNKTLHDSSLCAEIRVVSAAFHARENFPDASYMARLPFSVNNNENTISIFCCDFLILKDQSVDFLIKKNKQK